MGQMVKAGLLSRSTTTRTRTGGASVPANVNAANSWTRTASGSAPAASSASRHRVSLSVSSSTRRCWVGSVSRCHDVRRVRDLPRDREAGWGDPDPVRRPRRLPPGPTCGRQCRSDSAEHLYQRPHLRDPVRPDLLRYAGEPPGGDEAPRVGEERVLHSRLPASATTTRWADFVKGEGLYMVTGNWVVREPRCGRTGLRLLRHAAELTQHPPVATGGPGFPLSITAKSENPDVAAAYIDWMTDGDAAEMLVPTGQIPLSQQVRPRPA